MNAQLLQTAAAVYETHAIIELRVEGSWMCELNSSVHSQDIIQITGPLLHQAFKIAAKFSPKLKLKLKERQWRVDCYNCVV